MEETAHWCFRVRNTQMLNNQCSANAQTHHYFSVMYWPCSRPQFVSGKTCIRTELIRDFPLELSEKDHNKTKQNKEPHFLCSLHNHNSVIESLCHSDSVYARRCEVPESRLCASLSAGPNWVIKLLCLCTERKLTPCSKFNEFPL